MEIKNNPTSNTGSTNKQKRIRAIGVAMEKMEKFMKQTYIKPECEEIKVEIHTPMMAESVGVDVGNTPSTPDAPRRRGRWGNLWDTD